MRKSQREVKDFDGIVKILDKCQVIRLAVNDGESPYIVPLSFGYSADGGKLKLYFHCATEGKKVDLIASSNAVAVEADVLNGYVKTEHGVTADYASVIARGRAERVFGDEAIRGIELLLSHCGIEGYSARGCVMTDIVAVYRIDVESITGKQRFQ